MKTFIAILVFILIGAAGGLLLSKKYKASSVLGNIIAGISGALLLSWLCGLLGIGSGLAALSLLGILCSIIGALLFPFIICFIQQKTIQAQGGA